MDFTKKGLPMETRDTSAMVKILSKSVPKLQFLRELTKNSIESMIKSDSDKLIINWNFDENYKKKNIYKLSITDTGCGLKQEDLLSYINKLSSSGKKLGINDNYGIGAKISGLAYSPFGIEYYSWVDGIGSYCKLKELEGGNYGLEDLGKNTYTKHISIEEAPSEIKKTGHGTKIILLGSSELDNTGIFDDKREISKYIARRFFKLPDYVDLNVVEGPYDFNNENNNSHVQLRKIISQKIALDQNSNFFGVFNGNKFKVHWWILNDNVSDKNDSAQQLNRLSGHFGLLYQDELYEVFEKGSSINKMQEFGIKIGGKKIVLYLELLSEKAHSNPERTTILIDGEKLDFESYGKEFSEKMPKDIKNYIEEKAKILAYDNTDWQKNIDKLLKDLGMGKLKKDSNGALFAVFDENYIEKKDKNNNKNNKEKTGHENNLGLPSTYKSFKIPEVYFCSSFPDKFSNTNIKLSDYYELTDKSPSEFDRAAKYINGVNTLYVNLDFRALEKILDFVISYIKEKDESLIILYKQIIISVYTYNLIEAIVSVLLLANSGKWGPEMKSHALSSEALTAVAMVRSNIIKKSIEDIKNIKKD